LSLANERKLDDPRISTFRGFSSDTINDRSGTDQTPSLAPIFSYDSLAPRLLGKQRSDVRAAAAGICPGD
jgi:hypothetical protein